MARAVPCARPHPGVTHSATQSPMDSVPWTFEGRVFSYELSTVSFEMPVSTIVRGWHLALLKAPFNYAVLAHNVAMPIGYCDSYCAGNSQGLTKEFSIKDGYEACRQTS